MEKKKIEPTEGKGGETPQKKRKVVVRTGGGFHAPGARSPNGINTLHKRKKNFGGRPRARSTKKVVQKVRDQKPPEKNV